MIDADADLKLVRGHAIRLREHFNSVHIVACRVEDDGTCHRYSVGEGSWYERVGAMKTWLDAEMAKDQKTVGDDE